MRGVEERGWIGEEGRRQGGKERGGDVEGDGEVVRG